MAVLVEIQQPLLAVDAEEQRGADDQHADAHEPGAERNHEPVGDISDDLTPLPPQLAGIAGGMAREQGEDDAKDDPADQLPGI